MPTTQISLQCCICSQPFERSKSEWSRNARLGRPSYCSRACAGKGNLRNIPEYYLRNSPNLKRSGSESDEFSPFRNIYRIARKRAREYRHEFSLELQDLKDLYESQNGICPYTGWMLVLPPSTSVYGATGIWQLTPNCASLDRIDSSQGYTLKNVQFVSYMANIAKNKFTHEQMVEFCEAIADRGQ